MVIEPHAMYVTVNLGLITDAEFSAFQTRLTDNASCATQFYVGEGLADYCIRSKGHKGKCGPEMFRSLDRTLI